MSWCALGLSLPAVCTVSLVAVSLQAAVERGALEGCTTTSTVRTTGALFGGVLHTAGGSL